MMSAEEEEKMRQVRLNLAVPNLACETISNPAPSHVGKAANAPPSNLVCECHCACHVFSSLHACSNASVHGHRPQVAADSFGRRRSSVGRYLFTLAERNSSRQEAIPFEELEQLTLIGV